jgi:outer membrane cobalamin receptor
MSLVANVEIKTASNIWHSAYTSLSDLLLADLLSDIGTFMQNGGRGMADGLFRRGFVISPLRAMR